MNRIYVFKNESKMMLYKKFTLSFVLFIGCNSLYSQKDTLYVHHNDTLTLNIDQKFPSTVYWIYEDTLKEISVYLHLVTNSVYPVYLEVYTGDGPLIFFHKSGIRTIAFEDGNCFGELVYSVYKKDGVAILRNKNVSLKIVESTKDGLITTNRNFNYIGKRND